MRRLYLVLLGALGVALLLGLAEHSTASVSGPACADRPFCVTLVDQDDQSRSLDGTHYMKYDLVISRKPEGGTSNLTNGRLTLTLTDVLASGDVRSNAVFQDAASDARCDAGSGSSSHIVTCSVPNFPAGSPALEYTPLIFTTTSRAGATTRAVANVTFKEKGSDNQPSDPNTDSLTVTNETLYEPDPELDSSWAFPGAALSLVTDAAHDEQHSRFGVSVPASSSASFTAFVKEHPLTSALNPCGTNTCYGEIVETNTNGNGATLFSSTRPANVVITWDFLPSGKTQNNIVVYHRLDSGANELPITASCVRSGGAITNLPCRDVEIKRLGGGRVEVIVSIYSASNGGWGVG